MKKQTEQTEQKAGPQQYIVETRVRRQLYECFNPQDESAYLSVQQAIHTCNFHYLDICLSRGEHIRLEAVRSQPDPDENNIWTWPESYRLLTTKGTQQEEQVIDRDQLPSVVILGMELQRFDLRRLFQRTRFKSFSYCVGRRVKTCRPAAAAAVQSIGFEGV